MNALRALVGIAGLALLGLMVWAGFAFADLHGDLIQQFGVILSLPWGVTTLADLFVGYLLFSVLVYLVEKAWWTTALWAVPIFLFGNAWAALWFVVRLPVIAAKLAASAPPDEAPPAA
jgi:hypothetical protein